MSWGTCYSGSNNIYPGFAPLMSDGRNFSNWHPGATINENLKEENNISTNWQYRKFLTNNADKIIRTNQLEACDQCCGCPARYGDNQPLSNTPFLYKSCVDKQTPYGYETSDLKNSYLTDYQLQCRMVAPILTQDQYLTDKFPRAN
jgi:hypothetical protein